MNLRDFEPLSRAESLLLQAFISGGIARIGYRRPQAASPDVTLRAEFLSFLARGGDAGVRAHGRRIELLGAWVVGRFSLQGAVVPVSLWLFRCVFDTTPVLDGARIIGSVGFPDCALPALRAEACHIAGALSLNSGCQIEGEVRLTRATIVRDLDCERAQFGGGSDSPPPGQQPLAADGARIGGDVRLGKGFAASGEVRFVGARIDGDLRASHAHLTGSIEPDGARQVALNLDRVRVAGSVLFGVGFTAAGCVRLERARIAGNLDGTGAAFDVVGDAGWSEGTALLLDGAASAGPCCCAACRPRCSAPRLRVRASVRWSTTSRPGASARCSTDFVMHVWPMVPRPMRGFGWPGWRAKGPHIWTMTFGPNRGAS